MDFIEKIEEYFISSEKGSIYKTVIENTEKIVIERALRESSGNQILAARILGLNRNTLRTKIKKFNINTEFYKI